MFSFPLIIFLIPYGLVVVLFAFTAFYSVHNLIKYGATTHQSFLATFAFLAGATLLFFFTWQLLRNTDWTLPITINLQFRSAQTGFVQPPL